MKAIKLTLTLTVLMFAFSASAQKINSNKGKSWPKNGNSTSQNSDLELSAEEIESLDGLNVETDQPATKTTNSTPPKAATASTATAAATNQTKAEDDLEDEADIAAIDQDLEEIDDLLATGEDDSQYEVIETRYIDGRPLTQTKKVSKSELQRIVSKRKALGTNTPQSTVVSQGVQTASNRSAVTTTKKTSSKVIKRGQPRRRVVRRVLRTRSAPSASSSRSSQTSTTVVKTRAPVIKAKANKRIHIMPVLGASYGRIEGNFLTNRFQNSLESDFGLTGGALVEYREKDWMFGFEAGIIYNQSVVTGDMTNSVNQTASLDYMVNEYLMFPVSAKFYPLRLERFNMHILAGVAGGVLLDSNFEQKNFGTFNTTGSSAALFKDGEFQWQAGGGAAFRVTEDFSLAIEGKFYRSLSDITDSSNNIQGGEAYNMGWSTYAGLVIHL